MRWLILWAVVAFGLDQASKWYVFQHLEILKAQRIEVLPPYLVFVPGINTGVNFGLFSDGSEIMRYVLIGLALLICAGLIWWAATRFTRRIEFTASGLLIGGALANVLDRVFHPGVLDFLNMSCCGFQNPYVFNIADVFIFAGAFGLILWGGEKKDA